MSRKLAAITGVHGYVPDYILNNAELETMVDTTDEWIRSRTGVKERHILKGEMTASDMGARMLEGLLAKTNTRPQDIDLLVCATITGDKVFPDTATTVLDKVGAKNAYGYDINAACCGFLFSLTAAAQYIQSGTFKKVVVIGIDVMSSIVDYTDRTTCVLFGDGGGAVLLEAREDGTGLLDSYLRADGSGRQYLYMAAGGSELPPSAETVAAKQHYVYQEGRTVFKYAVKGMEDSVRSIIKRNDLTLDDIRWLVPHQANIRIIKSVADALEFPMERVMVNIQKYGNTTSGTLPLCLWDYEKHLNKGDNILLTAFGGGFTWGATFVKWAY